MLTERNTLHCISKFHKSDIDYKIIRVVATDKVTLLDTGRRGKYL